MHPIRNMALMASSVLLLAVNACASGPQRGGPTSGQGGGPNGGNGENRSGAVEFEGTLAKPIGLLFTSMDSNSDSRVTRAEIEAGIRKEWQALSSRGTVGAIVLSDWSDKALGSREAQPTFLMFDKNFNSSISEKEFIKRMETEFERLDENSDNILDRSEMIITIMRPQARGQSGGAQGGGQGGGRGGGQGGGGPQR